MKVVVYIWIILFLSPAIIFAQVRINGTSEIRVLEDGAVRVTGNTEIASGAGLSILGDFSTSANLINNGSATQVIVESDASQTGSLIVEGTAIGNIRVERYLTPSTWHFVAPSVSGANTGDFYFNGNPEVWASYFDESTGAWPYITGTNIDLPLGLGYKMWVGDSKAAVTAEMEGNVRTSDLSVNLTTSGSGWNLIGNPFTSELDVRLGNWGDNTSGSFWVWDKYFNGGDYRVSNGLGEGTLDGIIPISQSFFVYAETAGNFTIPKEAQTHHDTAEFYKDAKSNDFIRLQLDFQENGNTLFIGFPSIGSSHIDRLADTYKIYSTAETPQLYGIQDDEKLCILADAPLDDQVRIIPIYIDQWATGSYTLTLSDAGGLENMDIYLEDNSSGEFIHLSQTKIYQFSGTTNSTQHRFNLHFNKKETSIDELCSKAQEYWAYSQNQYIFIRANSNQNLINSSLKLYNIKGQLIFENNQITTNFYQIPGRFEPSCYFVYLQNEGETNINKVIVQ